MKSVDWTKFAFFASLCLAAFGLGAATVEFKTFPSKAIHEARTTATLWWRAYWPKYESDKAFDSKETLGKPTVRRHAGAPGDELILVSGGRNYLKDLSPEYGALAWIMDRDGAVRHVWHFAEDFWSDLKSVTLYPGKPIYPVGLHVYPNGDLLVSFQGMDSWPYGIGIAKLDKDSKLLWKKELNTHHWFTLDDDGRIYVPAQHVVDTPMALKGRKIRLPGKDRKLLSDTVMVLDPEGNVLDEISMIDAVVDADRVGLLSFDPDWDPIHLNDVRVVTRELEATHPMLNVGDLLVSLRNLNTVGILDGRTKRFKWLSSPVTVRQHSPRFFDRGVLVFDNMGGPSERIGSQLVWFDLSTNESRTIFPRSGTPVPDVFYSKYAGHIDISSDTRRLLITLTYSGSIWEVDVSSGEVPWQYVYAHTQLPGFRRSMHTAKYLPTVTFPMNRDKAAP